MGDKLGEAKSSGNLGNTLKVMGKFDEAMICCKRHLEISRELKDKVCMDLSFVICLYCGGQNMWFFSVCSSTVDFVLVIPAEWGPSPLQSWQCVSCQREAHRASGPAGPRRVPRRCEIVSSAGCQVLWVSELYLVYMAQTIWAEYICFVLGLHII